ncbi:ATP-binding protein [Naasia lichenicola]|uniref:LuxR family transcriptional regulator n=1 Tax=Naasia lichenicola TaxID=2565933 RepID=A0A4S4FTF2_9MICO|nr:AAA family ATPase [Naasia lichenicola]THG32856.1 LuxR family transcriptional regulator [Naasia lichenicola]
MTQIDVDGTRPSGRARTRRAPTRGRDEELRFLESAVRRAAAGLGGWVAVTGQPGSGKTRVLEDLEALASAAGVRYFYGSGDSEGHLTPFAPLLNAMQSGGISLLEEHEVEGLESSPEDRFWILQELQDGLDHASLGGPMVVVIDDVQWCDDATLLAMKTLPQRLVASPILWVVAVRQSALRSSRVVSVFERYADIEANVVTLQSLSDEAVAMMVEDLVGFPPDAGMLKSVLQAEGLPLYVQELLTGLIDEGLVQVENGVATLLGAAVPQRFRESVRARAMALSGPGRQTLEVASVIGQSFALDVLADMLDVSVRELIDPVREAVEAGLLLEVGDDLRFSHDLFREIIQEGVPSSAHRILQRKAIDVQLARGGDVVEVATMLASSAQFGDLEAVLLLRSAARQLSSLTPSTAADLVLRALELAPDSYLDRAELVTETATYMWQGGQAKQARQLIEEELSRTTSSEEEARLRIGIADMSRQFSFAEAVRHSRMALALPGLSEGTRALLESQLAMNSLMTGDHQRVVDKMSAEPNDLALLASHTMARAATQFYGGQWQASFASSHESLVIADRAHIRYLSSFSTEAVFLAFAYASIGDIRSALREADRGVQETTRSRQGGAMRLWVMVRSRILLDAGRLADATVESNAVLEMVDELGPGNFADITAIYTLVRVALYEGDVQAMARWRPDAERMMKDEASRIQNVGSWLVALCYEFEGRSDEAIALALPVIDRLHIPSPYFVGSTDAADDVVFVRLALRTGHQNAALKMIEFIENRARENHTFSILRATALHARALLTDDRMAMVKAITLLESIERPIVLASAVEDLARMTRPVSALEAIDLYRTAKTLYAEAGAFREEARVNRKLAALGERDEGKVSADGTVAWTSLSAAQREVVALIVQGLTNRQVAEKLRLSPHTVNAHLRYAFTKLSVHSRVELAGLYHRMETPTTPRATTRVARPRKKS